MKSLFCKMGLSHSLNFVSFGFYRLFLFNIMYLRRVWSTV